MGKQLSSRAIGARFPSQLLASPQVTGRRGQFRHIAGRPGGWGSAIGVLGPHVARAGGGHAWAAHHEGSLLSLPWVPRLISSTAAAATHWAWALPVDWRSCPARLISPDTPPCAQDSRSTARCSHSWPS
jgi:hypothetical protein